MSSSEINPAWFEEQLTLKGLTVQEFCAHAKVSTATAAKIVKGEALRVSVKVKIVNAFNHLPNVKGMAEAIGRAS